MPIPRTVNQVFFKTWSADMAYVLGYFAADGSMIENNRGSCFVEFTSTDKILLEEIRAIVGSNHKISERPVRNKKWKQQYRLQIGSREWFNQLTRLGFVQSKSKILAFPRVPAEYIGAFVRGYFDGDGCVYFGETVSSDRKSSRWVLSTLFISGSRSFLEVLHKSLKEYGVRGGTIKTKARGFELVFSHRDSLALYRLMYHTGEVARIFLPRKREKLERAIQVLKLDKSCGRSSTG